MKKVHKNTIIAVSDIECSELMHEIAVVNGLQTPQTPEEVDVFEKQFASEIAEANKSRPSLSELLSLANEIKNSGTAIVNPIPSIVIDAKYQMAARNGNEITEETEELMDKAIQKAKENRSNE